MADVSLVLGAVGAGRLPPREGTEPEGIRTWPDVPLGNFPCYGTYETADDRFVSFGNIETKFWDEFLAITGLTHLSGAQFATGAAASAADSAIAKVIGSRTLGDWEDAFADRDVCFAPVRTLREAVGTTDVLDRGLVETRDNDLLIAAFPATFSGTPARVGGAVPEPGEHNRLFFGPSEE
jgi:crotonobetainyl-CoA:carnitine CoA-transferase CaiB-like acyl-CoA transferase